jgi:hypothetical protein
MNFKKIQFFVRPKDRVWAAYSLVSICYENIKLLIVIIRLMFFKTSINYKFS